MNLNPIVAKESGSERQSRIAFSASAKSIEQSERFELRPLELESAYGTLLPWAFFGRDDLIPLRCTPQPKRLVESG